MDVVRFDSLNTDTGLSFVHSPQDPLLCSSPLLNQAAIQQDAPQPVAHSCLDQLDFYGLLQRSPLIAQSLSLRQVSQLLDNEQTEELTGTRLGAPLVQPDDVNRLEYNRLSREQQGITATVSDAIARTMQQLQQFAADWATIDQLRPAFGTVWDVGTAQELIKQIVSNGFSRHSDIKLEIRPTTVPGIQGAFTAQTNTIYLFEDFLAAHIGHPDAIAAVLLEEVGHYIDAQLNSTDSPGDEGAIFAALVQGHSLSEQTLASLKVEDDFATLVVNDQIVPVECAAANDNWANAFSLSGTTSSVSGNNIGATAQSGEPAQSGTINSVWWKWTAPNYSGTLTLDTFGSSFNTYLSLFSGTSVNSLTLLARNDDTDGYQSRVQFATQANQTYYIAVDGNGNATGNIKLNHRFGQPTANDKFASATTLSGTSSSVSGSNAHALGELGEPTQSDTINSAWWKWTAPSNGVLTVDTLGSNFDAYLSLFSSSTSTTPSFGNLTILGQDDYSAGYSQGRVQVEVQSGKTYYIAVDGFAYDTGNITLNYKLAQPPGNDKFANAAVLSNSSGQIAGTNVNALGETGEPAQSGTVNSVWWKWTAPSNGVFTIDTSASNFATYLSVFNGSSLSNLTRLAQNGEGWSTPENRWQAEVQAGKTYYIAVDGYDTLTGNISLNYKLAQPPGNDKFANATGLTGRTGRVVGSNVNALSEAGEPEQSWITNSVWWRWTAPTDGVLSVDTVGSNFDTYLSLFSGSSLNTLTLLVQNDDISNGNYQSRVQVPVRKGITYYIAVDGYSDNTGAITLNYQLVAPPANDHFVNAKLLPSSSGQDTGSTIDATAEPGEPTQDSVINSVWWKWTAPANGVFTVETSDASFIGTYLSLFSGSSLSNLTVLAQDGSGQSRVQAAVQANTTYYIAVDGYSNRMVDFNLNYRFGQPPANDQFANASVLSTSSGQMIGSTMNALAEIEEPEQSGAINSLWWKWTAPQDGIFSIDPSNSPIETYVSVFSGSRLNTLTVLAQSNSENLQERIKIPVQAGITYYIAADGYDNILGDILLTYQFELPPANDKRVNATELTGTSGRELGSNQTALAEVGEPEQSGEINSVWWKWTAPQDGLFTLDTFGSNFDTYLSLFSGSPSNLTLLAQNDDTSGVQSLVKAQVRAGDTYYIAVDGYNENTGNITLNYQFGPSPTNDKFTQAIELTNPTGTVLGTTVNAFAEAGEPAQSGTINSVWWKWIAPRDGTFTVDTMGSSGNPYLSVLKGSSVNTLTVLGQQAGQQPMQITVQANTTYYIAVDGTDNTTGGVTLNYRFTANNVAPTDLRLSATQVSEGQPVGTLVGSFSTVDADADNTFSYRLVAGPGDEGNGLFTIVGHQLYTHHVFDYETQQRYSIRVQTQDNRGGTYEKVLTIAIIDNVRDNFTSSIHAALATDTAAGGVNSDGITSEPTIQGTISEPHQLVSLRAGVDAMPTTAFANVLPDLQADGSFRFSRARLEAIAGKRLSDGAHVVQLQATDRYGNTKSLAVSFTLDTTTPTFEVQGLIDGISWSTTERLKGQLKQIDPDVWMVYQFDDQGETELLINADGTFNKLLAVPSQAGEHTLKVSSIDQAGNRQTKAFRFLVKPQRVAIDDDLLTSSSGDGGEGDGSGIDGGGSSGGGSGGNGGTGSGTTGSGSPAMEWWLYGGGNSSGSNGGSGSPPPPPPPPPPPEAPPTYLEKVAIILDRALYSMGEEEETIHKKAALKNRITMLMELAAIVDHYQMYDQMEGVLHGIYDEAEETIQTRDEASERGVDLAIQLLEDSDAVRTEVYQSALLTVANQVWMDKQYPALSEDQQQQLVNGLLELGRTYAALKPTLAPDTATTTTPDFLDALWRAQLPSDPSTPKPYQEIRAELLRGITALDTLLDGVEDPLGALRFVNNLVQAVTNVESLSEEGTLDAQFLRELVAFGFEYAKLNPSHLESATENGVEAFLATLWQSNSTEAESIAVKEATGKLSELFAGFDTPEARLQWLRFATNLVQAVGQSLAPEENADPTVVSALIELGAVYAQLNPTPAATEPPLNFFLDTLWQAQDDIGLRTGAEQLQSFVQDIADPTRLLRLATGLLRAMESLSLEQPPDAQMLSALLELGKAYAVLDPVATTPEADQPLNFFLDTLWQNQDELAIAKATEELQEFLESGNTKEKRVKVIGFQKNLLKATKLITDFQSSVKDSLFINDIVTLGNLYTFLRFSEESQSSIYFLANVWEAQNQQELEDAANNFQNLISETIDGSVEISTIVAQNLFDQLRRRFGGNPEVYTGLWPWQERQDSFHEAQRQWALDLVRENAEYICEVANYYGITAHAIAGAILWEALENPYNLIGRGGTGLFRPGGPLTFGIPGKIHTAPDPDHPATDPEVENRVRQRRPDAFSSSVPQDPSIEEFERTNRLLRDPTIAIEYIGAILAEHVEDWETVAREEYGRGPGSIVDIYNIRDQAGILGMMYQGLEPEQAARNFENRRQAYFQLSAEQRQGTQPPTPQLPERDAMGNWISQYRWWIARYLEAYGCRQTAFIGSGEIPVPESFEPRAEYDIWNNP